MTKRRWVAAGVVATISLFVCAGCNRTTDKTPESSPEFRQIKTSLAASQKLNEQLSQDVQRLNDSLKEAESRLAETTKVREGLQGQVQQLTASRGDLEAKVNELGKARVSLETRVNDLTKSRDDLQQTVESLTKAKNAALDDARSAQAKVDALNEKLKVQTQQVTDLQGQIKTIRSVLEQLQKKLG